MTKYLYRTCPKCKDYLGVVVRDPPERMREILNDAYYVRCGYKEPLRKIIFGQTRSTAA